MKRHTQVMCVYVVFKWFYHDVYVVIHSWMISLFNTTGKEYHREWEQFLTSFISLFPYPRKKCNAWIHDAINCDVEWYMMGRNDRGTGIDTEGWWPILLRKLDLDLGLIYMHMFVYVMRDRQWHCWLLGTSKTFIFFPLNDLLFLCCICHFVFCHYANEDSKLMWYINNKKWHCSISSYACFWWTVRMYNNLLRIWPRWEYSISSCL